MKKGIGFTLASLALAALPALSAPAFAKFEVSVRGDVGATGSQVPYFWVDTMSTAQTGAGLPITQNIIIDETNRDDGVWDFTARAAWYMGCAPCAPYLAASYQYSNHKKNTTMDPVAESATLFPYFFIPLESVYSVAALANIGDHGLPVGPGTSGSTLAADIDVLNKLSKFKFGFGTELLKCCSTFAVIGEFGLSAVNAHLNISSLYTTNNSIGELPLGLSIALTPGPTPPTTPYKTFVNIHEIQKTEGLGLYAMLKGIYTFPSMCGGRFFSVYGKVEATDYYARQMYTYNQSFNDHYNAMTPNILVIFSEHLPRRYNNVVEVDLEAAIVYSPFSSGKKKLKMDIAVGVRNDSYVNLFVHPRDAGPSNDILSLARTTVFGELNFKF